MNNAPNTIGITQVGSPAQDVSLAEDMARLVVGLIEQTQPLRASASASAIEPPSPIYHPAADSMTSA